MERIRKVIGCFIVYFGRVNGEATQPVSLALLKLSMTVYGHILDG